MRRGSCSPTQLDLALSPHVPQALLICGAALAEDGPGGEAVSCWTCSPRTMDALLCAPDWRSLRRRVLSGDREVIGAAIGVVFGVGRRRRPT